MIFALPRFSLARFIALLLGGLAWSAVAHAQTTGALEGRVFEAATGAPLPGVNVALRQADQVRGGASTDAEGRFRVEGLPAGGYTAQATAVGYAPARQRVRVAAGETTSLTLRLEEQTLELNEIVVRGGRTQEATASTVQRLSVAEIAQQDPASVADLARLIPAAHVQTNSRGQTLLYLRDAGERQTAQFFDGALLNVPWDNRVDLSLLPASLLESVTVSKGVPSVRYGANVIGGAVNFQTRALERPGRRTEATVAVGTPRAGRTSLFHQRRQGAFSYAAALGVAASGDVALPDGADVPFSQPGTGRRVNTDSRLANGFLRGAYQFDSGAQVAVSALHVDAEKGIAPESHVDPDVESVRYWRYPTWRQSMLIVSGAVPLGSEARLNGSAWGSRFEQDIFQYRSVAYDRLQETQGDLDYTAGARLIFEQPVGPGMLDLSLNALATRHHQANVFYEEDTPTPDSVSVYRQNIFSLGGAYALPLTDRLEVSAGASLDASATPDTGPWPALDPNYAYGLTSGLTYDVTSQVTLRAAAGRKTRFPTMRERFGAALGKFVPNPGLKPVSALLAEGGGEWRAALVSVSATAFLNRTYDVIDATTLQSGPDAGKERRINLDGSRNVGVELVARARPTDRLAASGHLTWMRPRGFSEGQAQKLDEKPAWLGALTLTYDLPLSLRALVQAEYLGGVYTRTSDNTFVELPAATVFDARLGYLLTPAGFAGGEVFVRLNNLTDELRLLQLGLPGPGREVRAGLEVSF